MCFLPQRAPWIEWITQHGEMVSSTTLVFVSLVATAQAALPPSPAHKPGKRGLVPGTSAAWDHEPQLAVRGGEDWMTDVFAAKIAPALGTVVANVMFLASLPAVLDARAAGALGDLNPVPWAMILANCVAWLHYGFLQGNPYIFWSNALGSLLGLFYTMTGMALGDAAQRQQMENIALGFSAVHVLASYFSALKLKSAHAKQLLAGYIANAIVILYYAAPLSTMAAVLESKSASSIHGPLVAVNGANGALWLVYGLTIGDPFVWVPNGTGSLLAGLQLALKAFYGDGAAPKAL